MITQLKKMCRLLATGLILFIVTTIHIQAATIDFEPVVGTISGSDTVVFVFDIFPGQADYRAILTDLESPAAFVDLGLAILTEAGVLINSVVGGSLLTLDFNADPGTYLAVVGGIAGGDNNISTFGLEISNLPVPPSIVLFLSSIVGLTGLSIRRSAIEK